MQKKKKNELTSDCTKYSDSARLVVNRDGKKWEDSYFPIYDILSVFTHGIVPLVSLMKVKTHHNRAYTGVQAIANNCSD